jgi:hypothetical protein
VANNITKIRDVDVYIGTYGDKWIAATGSSPYICLEADSAEALEAKINRLAVFIKKVRAEVRVRVEQGRENPKTFIVRKKIRLKELVDAA